MQSKTLKPQIVHENPDWLVIDKPAGLDSQNSKESRGSVVDWMREKFGYAGLVHRLDLNTSGLLVCAKNEKAAKQLTDAMQAGKIDRGYMAIVFGRLENSSGQIMHTLDGKPSVTHYTVVERFPNASLVKVDLETGRKHQIRRHFALEGHPLLGDHLYKKGGSHLLFRRPALHAYSLKVLDRTFEIALPEDFEKILKRLRDLKSNNP